MHYNQYQNHPVSMNLIDLLCSEGVAQVKPLFSENTIKHWNALLDPAFAKQNAPRKYVSAIELLDMGLLNEIFNEQMLGIIFKLIPDAELYHCHVYEINGNNKEPHIKANNQLSGWHRDTDCKFRFFTPKPQHISIFVYLSDVSSTGGCFELTNKPLTFLPTGFKDEVY